MAVSLSEAYIQKLLKYIGGFSDGVSTQHLREKFPRAPLKQLEEERKIWYYNDAWYIRKEVERTPEEKEYVKNQEEAAQQKDLEFLKGKLIRELKDMLDQDTTNFYDHYREELEKTPENFWEDVVLKVMSELAAEAEAERYPVKK